MYIMARIARVHRPTDQVGREGNGIFSYKQSLVCLGISANILAREATERANVGGDKV